MTDQAIMFASHSRSQSVTHLGTNHNIYVIIFLQYKKKPNHSTQVAIKASFQNEAVGGVYPLYFSLSSLNFAPSSPTAH